MTEPVEKPVEIPIVRMAEGYREIEEKVQEQKPANRDEDRRIRQAVQEELNNDGKK